MFFPPLNILFTK